MNKETETPKKYIQVFINGDENNLPKEKGIYFAFAVDSDEDIEPEFVMGDFDPQNSDCIKEWLQFCKWYLIEHPSNLLTKEQEGQSKDSEMLNWIERIMIPKDNYCEVFFAGLRNGNNDADMFQIESNPERFPVLQANSLREVISKAMKVYSQPEQPSKAESKMITLGEVKKLLDHHNDVYGPGNDDYGRDKWPVIDKELIVKSIHPDKEQKTADVQAWYAMETNRQANEFDDYDLHICRVLAKFNEFRNQGIPTITDEDIIDYALDYVSHKSLKSANKGLIKDALIIGAKAMRNGKINKLKP